MKFKLVIPTFNGGDIWQDCIDAILGQDLEPDEILVIDSGSSDRTVENALNAGFRVIQIQQSSYNHGGTRQMAVDDDPDFDFVVFLTQDAVLADSDSLKKLLEHFIDNKVAAVCGRQLPRKSAGPIESHARLFNYTDNSYTRSIQDVGKYGLKTAFISNSFAAYRVSIISAVGGFPRDVIFGEDMCLAAKALNAGYKISYAASARVYHSHSYSVKQEFKRYFDMGVLHSRQSWLQQRFGTAEGEGLAFVASESKYLLGHAFWRLPEALIRSILKYAGFRLGSAESRLPLRVKRKLSMNPGYFK